MVGSALVERVKIDRPLCRRVRRGRSVKIINGCPLGTTKFQAGLKFGQQAFGVGRPCPGGCQRLSSRFFAMELLSIPPNRWGRYLGRTSAHGSGRNVHGIMRRRSRHRGAVPAPARFRSHDLGTGHVCASALAQTCSRGANPAYGAGRRHRRWKPADLRPAGCSMLTRPFQNRGTHPQDRSRSRSRVRCA